MNFRNSLSLSQRWTSCSLTMRSVSSLMKGGSLELIFGPMFSGKTTELLRRMRRYKFATKSCLLIKYRADVRYNSAEGDATTHDLEKSAAFPCYKLSEAHDMIKKYDVIGIDEGQFFPDLFEFVEKWSDEKIIVVAALDGNFQRKPFGQTLHLVPMAENVTKLSAVCMSCRQKDAHFSRRISEETEEQVIGGAEKYIAVCRSCYKSNNVGNKESEN